MKIPTRLPIQKWQFTPAEPVPIALACVFCLVGLFIMLLALGVIEYTPVRRSRGLFEGPQHWQIAAIGYAFFGIGLGQILARRWQLLGLLVTAPAGIAFFVVMAWFVYFSGKLDLGFKIFASIPLGLGGLGMLMGMWQNLRLPPKPTNSQAEALADPLAEAQIYRQYGRYAQARQLLRLAMQRYPLRASEFQQMLDEMDAKGE